MTILDHQTMHEASCSAAPNSCHTGKWAAFIALLTGILVGIVNWFHKPKSVSSPKSPGAVLSGGWKMSPEDADMLRRVSDPKNPAGKAKLRCGPAMRG